MRGKLWIGMAFAGAVWVGWLSASEPVCFRTPADAAGQTGVRGVSGYRLESVNRDVYAGTVWAVVKSCEHPERPGMVVFAGTSAVSPGVPQTEARVLRPFLLQAGAKVQVVMDDGLAHVEMGGVALAGGAAGDQVRIRLTPVNREQTTEQFAMGVVRGSGVVEVVAR